jgi:pimeloyl-ACP methyl ester carboxylesterase
MPPAHGRRLAALIPRARYAEIPGAYVLSMLDEPAAVAREVSAFLTSTPAANEPGQDQDRP